MIVNLVQDKVSLIFMEDSLYLYTVWKRSGPVKKLVGVENRRRSMNDFLLGRDTTG